MEILCRNIKEILQLVPNKMRTEKKSFITFIINITVDEVIIEVKGDKKTEKS